MLLQKIFHGDSECITQRFLGAMLNKEAQPVCSYIPSNKCGGDQPLSCCERIAEPSGGTKLGVSVGVGFLLLTISINLL